MENEKHHLSGDERITIRLAQASDASGIATLYPAFLESYGHTSDVAKATHFLSHLLNEPWALFFVATDGSNNIIGFLGGTITYSSVSHRKAATINDLYVVPSARKRGIAKALLAELETYSQRTGLVKLFVEAASNADDVLRLYGDAGFEIQTHVVLKKELGILPFAPKSETEVFNYLTVLTSVILGLGLSHLLVGYARLIQTPGLLSSSWLYSGWLFLLLPLYFTYWWAFWDYREQVLWNFLGFSLMLLGPVGLYFITALYLPDHFTTTSFGIHDHYLQIRPWTYGLWASLQIWGIMLAPWLKQGLKWSSFFNRYKVAQYVLLLALMAGYFNDFHWMLDGAILIIFWLVLLYILTAHRRSLR